MKQLYKLIPLFVSLILLFVLLSNYHKGHKMSTMLSEHRKAYYTFGWADGVQWATCRFKNLSEAECDQRWDHREVPKEAQQ